MSSSLFLPFVASSSAHDFVHAAEIQKVLILQKPKACLLMYMERWTLPVQFIVRVWSIFVVVDNLSTEQHLSTEQCLISSES